VAHELPNQTFGNGGSDVQTDSNLYPQPQSPAFERHWSAAELATLWGLSEDLLRRLFADEPGVLHISRPVKGKARLRAYTTLRIPQSVVERVHRRCSFVK
jgi:hypothetical protein